MISHTEKYRKARLKRELPTYSHSSQPDQNNLFSKCDQNRKVKNRGNSFYLIPFN